VSAAETAADMIELRGEMALLNQRLESSLQAFGGNLSSLLAEVHIIKAAQEKDSALLLEKMGEVGTTSMQLSLLTQSIREHNTLERARQEKSDAEMKELRRKSDRFGGMLTASGLLLTLLIGMVTYTYNSDKGAQRDINIRSTEVQSANRERLITHEERIRVIEQKLGMKQEEVSK
jgi:hypothetical protein